MLRSKFITGTVVTVAVLVGQSAFAQDVTLPQTMVWTSYDLGSTGYVEASAMADALDKEFGTTVRLTPSGTAIGRMLPLIRGRASYGFMGNEILFAGDASYEFAAQDWGPQDLRVLMGRPAAVGLVTGQDTDIQSSYDLKDQRVGFVQASPSTLMNTEAALAFGNLTKEDVEQVIYPSYGAMVQGFIGGEIDVVPVTTTVAALREAEGGRGVRWLDMPASDTEGWERVVAEASLFSPTTVTVGVSISEDDPADLLGYSYPQLTTLAGTSEDEVYNLVKALDETFELYKNANPVMPRWKLDQSGKAPAGAPFHSGAIKYLREIDVWTEEDDTWNETRIAEIEETKAMWESAAVKARAEGLSEDDWPAFWETYRDEALN
ncbi:TAXI family TRAP transporter solute-binding subunit [Saccharospirillum sp.]|uniref:TAXI family TRAP transporter solute-binding subunit n=1 Tax=Saccharospirillum sp. TaxID=2033801 RepID=UPI0034A09387